MPDDYLAPSLHAMYGQDFPAPCGTCDEIVRFFDTTEVAEELGSKKGWGFDGDKNLEIGRAHV